MIRTVASDGTIFYISYAHSIIGTIMIITS